MMLGGRAAENITFGRVTTGAQNDLEKVTKQANAMVKWYGMNDILGPLSFLPEPGVDERTAAFTMKPYSKRLGNLIDEVWAINKIATAAINIIIWIGSQQIDRQCLLLNGEITERQ
jgi:ATP-dependent Zn protease